MALGTEVEGRVSGDSLNVQEDDLMRRGGSYTQAGVGVGVRLWLQRLRQCCLCASFPSKESDILQLCQYKDEHNPG